MRPELSSSESFARRLADSEHQHEEVGRHAQATGQTGAGATATGHTRKSTVQAYSQPSAAYPQVAPTMSHAPGETRTGTLSTDAQTAHEDKQAAAGAQDDSAVGTASASQISQAATNQGAPPDAGDLHPGASTGLVSNLSSDARETSVTAKTSTGAVETADGDAPSTDIPSTQQPGGAIAANLASDPASLTEEDLKSFSAMLQGASPAAAVTPGTEKAGNSASPEGVPGAGSSTSGRDKTGAAGKPTTKANNTLGASTAASAPPAVPIAPKFGQGANAASFLTAGNPHPGTADEHTALQQTASTVAAPQTPVERSAEGASTSSSVPLPLPSSTSSTHGNEEPPALGSAQLIQTLHQSEMKIGLNSQEFGNISISTSLNHQMLSAQISLDHASLGHALTAQLSAIEEKLGSAYGLQTSVTVSNQNSSAGQGSTGGEQQASSRDSFRSVGGAGSSGGNSQQTAAPLDFLVANGASLNPGRLDITI